MPSRRPTRARSVVFACAIGGAIALAVAGIAAPWYARPDAVVWVLPILIVTSAIIVLVLSLASHREREANESAALAPAPGRPLELAPEELRRQLDTLRHTQGELLLAKQAAEAAMMAKGEFLATMSHEIRTPLNGVLPLLELVLSSKLAPDQRDYLATAYASARELLRIVDAILDYSKLDAERLELETIGLNLRELVDSVAQLMQRNAEAKGLRLSVTIDPNVRLAVRGDPVRLRQVLTNLVSNAIKFTEKGGVHIQVSKRTETHDHYEIVFAVRDSGIGIAADTAAKLFHPFSQADASTTRVFGGTGLGLAICKRLVDLMQGRIGVKSEPGRGSLFWFSVPLRKALGDVQQRRDLDGIRALVIAEDDAMFRRLHGLGAALGMEFTAAQMPTEALAKLRATASMGEKWRHSLLVVDGAPKPALLALLKNIAKDSSLNHVRLLLLGRAADIGADIPPDPRWRALAGTLSEEQFRSTLEQLFGIREPGARVEEAIIEPMLDAETAAPMPLSGRVLLVEDNPINRRVAQRLLDLHGLDVVAVADGREAVAKLGQERFDLVLMDCLMPVMDGYTATKSWRERERIAGSGHLPIVAMTANAMAGDRERCLASGMDDYISKPLDRAALVLLLRRWLQASERLPSNEAASTPTPVTETIVADTEPAPSTAQSALDANIVQDLLDTMGDEFGDLVRVYLEDAPERLRELDAAAADNDASAQVSPAHTLKSSSANIGAVGLSDYARHIEHAARTGVVTPPADLTRGIRGEYERVSAELRALLERGAG